MSPKKRKFVDDGKQIPSPLSLVHGSENHEPTGNGLSKKPLSKRQALQKGGKRPSVAVPSFACDRSRSHAKYTPGIAASCASILCNSKDETVKGTVGVYLKGKEFSVTNIVEVIESGLYKWISSNEKRDFTQKEQASMRNQAIRKIAKANLIILSFYFIIYLCRWITRISGSQARRSILRGFPVLTRT